MNKDLDRLQHICEACELLQRATSCDYAVYQDDRDKRAAVERYFEILGEAAKMVSAEMQKSHPDIPWRLSGDMRNFIIHSYVKVSPLRLWETAKNDIPMLFAQVRHLLGVYGDGWIPCTSHTFSPTDAECIEIVVNCIQKMKNAEAQIVDVVARQRNNYLLFIEAEQAVSLLTRSFRFAHSTIDWREIITNGERFISNSEVLPAVDELVRLSEWLIDKEDELKSLVHLK